MMHPEIRVKLDSEHFKSLVKKLQANVELLGKARSLTPWKAPTHKVTEKTIRATIEAAGKHLPLLYQEKYLEPLKKSLSSLLIRARARKSSKDVNEVINDQFERTIEILAGAIYCHVSKQCEKPLRAFLAVISNTYRSFLPTDLRFRDGFPSPPEDQYPPLAAFRSGEIAPYMLSSDAVKKLSGGSVGVVVLPAVYKEHPLLWTAIAHEVGGHEMLNAMPQLLIEFQRGVRQLFNVREIRSTDKLDDDQLIGLLWQYWAEETVADVCGVLNIGPSYGISLAIYQAALNHAIAKDRGITSDTLLRLWSGLAPQFAAAVESDVRVPELDLHPTDILKLHVIIGVVENLTSLLPAHRDEYVNYLNELASICAGGKNVVTFCGTLKAGPDVWKRIERRSLPLATMQDAARRVGAYIATAELNTFGGRSLQGIETWDQTDETTAQHIAASLLKGQTIDLADMGDDAQLLAGSTLAFVGNPARYDQITEAMLDALEISCARDPYWGVSLFHSLVEYKTLDPGILGAMEANQRILVNFSSMRKRGETPPFREAKLDEARAPKQPTSTRTRTMGTVRSAKKESKKTNGLVMRKRPEKIVRSRTEGLTRAQ